MSNAVGQAEQARHVHRDAVILPDGSQVTAVSYGLDPYARPREPDFGLYLDHHWQPPWPYQQVNWPDFGVPADAGSVLAALHGVLDRARGGQQVEVGCLGGHGRTGTALACLAILAGQDSADAVAWVRTNYCPKAVETRLQEEFVRRLRR